MLAVKDQQAIIIYRRILMPLNTTPHLPPLTPGMQTLASEKEINKLYGSFANNGKDKLYFTFPPLLSLTAAVGICKKIGHMKLTD